MWEGVEISVWDRRPKSLKRRKCKWYDDKWGNLIMVVMISNGQEVMFILFDLVYSPCV